MKATFFKLGHGALIPQSGSCSGTCSASATPKEPEVFSASVVLVFLGNDAQTPLLQLQTGLHQEQSVHQRCFRGEHELFSWPEKSKESSFYLTYSMYLMKMHFIFLLMTSYGGGHQETELTGWPEKSQHGFTGKSVLHEIKPQIATPIPTFSTSMNEAESHGKTSVWPQC